MISFIIVLIVFSWLIDRLLSVLRWCLLIICLKIFSLQWYKMEKSGKSSNLKSWNQRMFGNSSTKCFGSSDQSILLFFLMFFWECGMPYLPPQWMHHSLVFKSQERSRIVLCRAELSSAAEGCDGSRVTAWIHEPAERLDRRYCTVGKH